jgi:hypothetical protein
MKGGAFPGEGRGLALITKSREAAFPVAVWTPAFAGAR